MDYQLRTGTIIWFGKRLKYWVRMAAFTITGNGFGIYLFYEFSIAVLAVIILLNDTIRFYKIYKQQIVYLILATIIPVIACVLYIFKLAPFNADLTSFSLIFVGIFIAVGIIKQGLLEIIPVARKQIIENFSDGIVVIDTVNRIIDANPVMTFLTKLDRKFLTGKTFEAISKGILTASFIASEEISTTETVIETPEGKRHFEITLNPVKLNQRPIGKILIFHDITKRKAALDKAVESNVLLLKEIREKEKLIQDLDAYARSVAHNLKNPISGMLGVRDVIKDNLKNQKREEAVEILEMAHKQCLKMNKIVDELLLLSRIRKEDIRLISLRMNEIIDESLNRLRGAHNNFRIQIPEVWPEVFGHPQWIEEVWVNLMSNALKYGGNPPVVTIGYDKINGSAYRFWIQDNGDGLPQESLDKLFHDFERLNNKNKEGHGLGLSMIKRIIEKSGGEVLVTSENAPGKGCVFSFTLKTKETEQRGR